jgi:hypothetical protein
MRPTRSKSNSKAKNNCPKDCGKIFNTHYVVVFSFFSHYILHISLPTIYLGVFTAKRNFSGAFALLCAFESAYEQAKQEGTKKPNRGQVVSNSMNKITNQRQV